MQLACAPAAGGRLRVTVTDTGPGIPAASLGRLFVPFERLTGEQSPVEGTGLGLPLSRRLAEAMGGTLEVASAPGRGSAFWVELPRAGDPAGRLDPEPPEPPEPGQGEGAPAPAGAGLTVLYIEDNLSNLHLVDRIMGRWGVRLISAMRPQLGLDLAAEHHPDLVLLDLHLPDLPGQEVLRRLRAAPATAAIPVVILSADARPGLITRLLDQGARAFLTKPLDVKQLRTLLDQITQERQQAARR